MCGINTRLRGQDLGNAGHCLPLQSCSMILKVIGHFVSKSSCTQVSANKSVWLYTASPTFIITHVGVKCLSPSQGLFCGRCVQQKRALTLMEICSEMQTLLWGVACIDLGEVHLLYGCIFKAYMPQRSFRENNATRVKLRPSVVLYFIVSFLYMHSFGICGFCCELRVFWVSSKEACIGSGSDSLCSYRCKKQKGERHAMYPNLGGS